MAFGILIISATSLLYVVLQDRIGGIGPCQGEGSRPYIALSKQLRALYHIFLKG